MVVNNLSKCAMERKYIVAREVDGKFWFWGAWDEYPRALEVARAEKGIVIPSEEVEEGDEW